MSYVTHDARYDASLTGESVWDITLDSDGNWWFGTDNGISVSPDNGIVKEQIAATNCHQYYVTRMELFGLRETGEYCG